MTHNCHPRCLTTSPGQSEEDIPPEKFNHSMIGYHLAISNSLCGMAMTQGERQKVVNIGLGIVQYTVEPRGTSVATYVESMSHKACCSPNSFNR